LAPFFAPAVVQLLSGDFQGAEVMSPHSDEPIIITTEKMHGFIVINMIGKFWLFLL
jgi:hypothetical protein